jgi:Rieske [2Fe-2S] domain
MRWSGGPDHLAAVVGRPQLPRVSEPKETWYRVGSAADIRSGVPMAVAVGGQQVALFEYNGGLHAISNRCNHRVVRWPTAASAGSS